MSLVVLTLPFDVACGDADRPGAVVVPTVTMGDAFLTATP